LRGQGHLGYAGSRNLRHGAERGAIECLLQRGRSFVYTPAAGTVLTAGSQTLSVTFTPTDTTDYTAATSSVTLAVNKAAPTVGINLSSSSITMTQALTVTVAVSGASGAFNTHRLCEAGRWKL